MQNQESEVSDITVILKKECAEKLDETVAQLKKLEMTIENTDAENGAVEGTVAADKLAQIRACPCVEYVRVDFTYIAEHPGEASGTLDSDDDSGTLVG